MTNVRIRETNALVMGDDGLVPLEGRVGTWPRGAGGMRGAFSRSSATPFTDGT
jgi:hypothetical protein